MKVVRCGCGTEFRSDDEDDLIAQVQHHALQAHDEKLSKEQVRDMIEEDRSP